MLDGIRTVLCNVTGDNDKELQKAHVIGLIKGKH